MSTNKRQYVFMLASVAVAIILVVAGLAVRPMVNGGGTPAGSVTAMEAATPVKVKRVQRRRLAVRAEVRGFLAPFTELTLAPLVSGAIVEQWVDVSDDVRIGDPLFKTDEALRELEREQAAATHARAESEYDLAKANWQRLDTLPRETSASMERTTGEARYRGARADKDRTEVAVQLAALQLERTVLRSPMAGVVARVYRRKGEFAHVGQPLVDLIEVDRLKLLAEIEEQDVVWVKVGMPAELTADTFPGETFGGRVSRVYPKALPTSRKFEVEIELANPQRRLRPGFFMTGAITNPVDDDGAYVLAIPREAVVECFGRQCCYVVRGTRGDATPESPLLAERTVVSVSSLPSDPRSLRVVKGVIEGDAVVTSGVQLLSEQSPVRIIE